MATNKFKTIDLFAGIGGIRKGFEMTGYFENHLSAEIDPYACKTYEHLFGDNPFNDVTSEEFKLETEKVGIDVILGGFPCQAFSIAGQKKGFKDKTRGTLFFDIADIINRNKPKAFLLENVEGLTTHKKGSTFKTILEVLCIELGYTIPEVKVVTNMLGEKDVVFERASFIRKTKNFGLPQRRSRAYIIGFRNDIVKNHVLPPIPTGRTDLKMYRDLNDLLELGADSQYYLASGSLQSMKNHKNRHSNKGNGFGYIVVNEPSIKSPLSNTVLATGGSGKERNIVLDPQPHIGGMVTSTKKTPLNNEGLRNMTQYEWGKLQGFINYAFINKDGIDTFSFPSSISRAQQYKQFGNSVSIPVIESMALYIAEVLNSNMK